MQAIAIAATRAAAIAEIERPVVLGGQRMEWWVPLGHPDRKPDVVVRYRMVSMPERYADWSEVYVAEVEEVTP